MRFAPLLFILAGLFILLGANAQNPNVSDGKEENLPRSLITFRHDNDLFLFTDRYYSFGFELSYHRTIAAEISGYKPQFEARVLLKGYTPGEIRSREPEEYDRPYVGFSALQTGLSLAKKRNLFSCSILAGWAGPQTGMGKLQLWYHKNLRLLTPTWAAELPNAFHFNIYSEFLREWRLKDGNFAIEAVPLGRLAFGSWQQHAECGAVFHFGQKQPAEVSQAYSRLGSLQAEVFFSLSYTLKSIWHDGSFEGAPWGTESNLYTPPHPWKQSLALQFVFCDKRNRYQIHLQYDSPEAAGAIPHKYAGLSYGYAF